MVEASREPVLRSDNQSIHESCGENYGYFSKQYYETLTRDFQFCPDMSEHLRHRSAPSVGGPLGGKMVVEVGSAIVRRERPPTFHAVGSPDRGASGLPVRLVRSEEHTSELQSHLNLVCRLLLEKKKDTCHPL